MEEAKIVVLGDGRKAVLDDDNDICISIVSDNIVESKAQIHCPSGGYGGGFLQLSPSGKYLLFSFFSGESEEAFSLLRIEGSRLQLLYDSGYLYGEGAAYSFVDDEKILVQTFRTASWYEENAEADENGDMYYDFGELNLFCLDTRKLERHTVRVYPADGWEEEKTDAGPFLPAGSDGHEFSIITPWGKETFHEPLQDILVVRFI